MLCNVIDNALRQFFSCLGKQIGKSPAYFIAGPVLLSVVFSFGLFVVDYQSDPAYLYPAQNSRAVIDQDIQEKHFPQNYSDFDPSRINLYGKYGRLIIQAADDGTILREEVFNQIMYVDQLVKSLKFWNNDKGRNYSYEDVCARGGNGICYDNNVLNLGRQGLMGDIESGRKQLSYPVHLDTDTYDSDGNFMIYILASNLGGVTLSKDKSIMIGAEAINLNYFLDSTNEENDISATSWEMAFQEYMSANANRLSGLKITWFSSLTREVEFEKFIVPSVVPYFCYEIALMVVFCVMTCMTTDWVKSKPLIGFCGVASAMLGTLTAFGFCLYIGIPFAGVNMVASFLMLGIGIDDAFVTLAAWEKTSIHKSVPERLAMTYADAGASITITSLTDVISFFIGCVVPVPVCQIFCAYIAVSVIFTYLWHITLFGGCLALAGYAENSNRHSIACVKVLPKPMAGNKGFWYSVCCIGGLDKKDPENCTGNRENSSMVFFRDSFAPFLNKLSVKIAVLLLYTGYALFSAWALTTLRTENDWRRGVRQDSYAMDFYNAEEQFFKEFSFRISVIIDEPLDYSNRSISDDIENLITELEGHPNIAKIGTESWLRQFSDYVKSVEGDPIKGIDISDEQNFNEGLISYLSSGQSVAKDLHIQNGTIVASRFMLQAKELVATRPPTDLVRKAREIVDKYPYKIAIYHPNFIYSDLTILLPSLMVQCLAGAAGAMFLVCLVFIPNPLCSLWVTFSIVSIMSGVMGFMSLWGVDLDIITIAYLVVCIGLSVDFSAHISYHFMKYQDLSQDERVKETLYTLGLPIVQGATSSCLGVLGLGFVPLYIFQTFMKMVSLAVVIGAIHGIVFLPVFLSLTMGIQCQSKKKTQPLTIESRIDTVKTNM